MREITVSLLSCPWTQQLKGYVLADAVCLCDKAAVLRDVINENSLYEREIYLSNHVLRNHQIHSRFRDTFPWLFYWAKWIRRMFSHFFLEINMDFNFLFMFRCPVPCLNFRLKFLAYFILNYKLNIRECSLNETDSAQTLIAGAYECGKRISGSTDGGGICWLFERPSLPWEFSCSMKLFRHFPL